jgi:hypothetical protein
MDRNGQKEQKYTKMDKNEQKWTEMDTNGHNMTIMTVKFIKTENI